MTHVTCAVHGRRADHPAEASMLRGSEYDLRIGDRGSSGRLVGAVIALMLAVVALASTQPAFAPNESGSVELANQDWIGDAITIFTIGLVVVGMVALLLVIIFSGAEGGTPPPQKRSLASQLAFVIAVFLAARLGLFDHLRTLGDAFSFDEAEQTEGPTGSSAATPSEEFVPDGIRDIDLVSSLALGALFLVFLVALGWWSRHDANGQPAATTDANDETDALRQDLGRAATALDDDTIDHRRSVLACYEAMETTMADHGLGRRSHETPEDFLARTRDHLGTERPAAETLTGLVNHALYDADEVTASDRDRARAALEDLVRERAHVN